MNPLDLMGVCIVRFGDAEHRRGRIAFEGASLTDSPSGTIVEPGLANTYEATIGDADWSSSTSGDGGTFRYYDESGGDWFGLEDEFSRANDVIVRTALVNPSNTIIVRGFMDDPSVFRKNIVNLGPSPITLRSDEDDGNVTAVADIVLLPGDGVRMFWDSEDNCWRPIMRATAQLPDNVLTLQGDPLTLDGQHIVLPD